MTFARTIRSSLFLLFVIASVGCGVPIAKAGAMDAAADAPRVPAGNAAGAAQPEGSAPPAEQPHREPPPEVLKEIERQRQSDAKAAALKAAAAAHPDEVRYHVEWIDGLLDLGRDDEALAIAPALVERFPRSAELFVALSRAQLRNGQFEIAALQLQRAIAIDPASARSHTLLGKSAVITGDLKTAEAELRKALSLDSASQDARSALALVLERNARWSEAVEVLKAGKNSELTGRRALLQQFVKEPPIVIPSGFSTVTVPFVIARGYPPFVKVKIGPTVEKLLVIDTSSDEALLTQEAARALGLPDRGKEILKDEEGREHLTPVFTVLDQVRIGDLVVRRVPARVSPGLRYPDDQIAGTLGREFLRRFRVVLDYGAKSMTLSRPDSPPLDGVPFYQTSSILVEGSRGDRSSGMFVLDSSSYTPGVLDTRFVTSETGLNLYSEGVERMYNGPYLFKFTMPDLTVAGTTFKKFAATAVDLRTISRKIGVNVNGVVGYSLLRQCRVEIDFKNQRLSLTKLEVPAPAPDRGPEPPAPGAPETPAPGAPETPSGPGA